MDSNDYEALLKSAREQLPENVGNKDRWQVPLPDLIKEGRMTILRNHMEIVKAVRRDEAHVTKYLLSQIGTAGSVDGDRLVMTGKVSEAQVTQRLQDYVEMFVRCAECGSPDTHMEKEGRVPILKCEACGAHTPIKARKGARKDEGPQVKMGAVLELHIEQNGPRGEGLVTMEGYTIIVPKTPAGSTVKVKITRITGRNAFSEVVA